MIISVKLIAKSKYALLKSSLALSHHLELIRCAGPPKLPLTMCDEHTETYMCCLLFYLGASRCTNKLDCSVIENVTICNNSYCELIT